MTRRRMSDKWHLGLVAEAEIAPHHYTYNGGLDEGYRMADDWRTFMAGVPYKEGDVVYVERMGNGFYYAAKARIIGVHAERDRYGDLREKFKVQFATAKGTWSKLFEYTYPGPIQRGYQCAGLAPDEPYEHGLKAIGEVATFLGKMLKYPNFIACLRAKDELNESYREIQAFAKRVKSLFPNAEVKFNVNSCALYWERGTKPDFTAYVGIVGALSYNGGGKTPAGALRRTASYFDQFVGEHLAKLVLALNGQDPSRYHKPFVSENYDD